MLSAGDASSLAHELERFHLLWFDEPCRLSNLSAARKIAVRDRHAAWVWTRICTMPERFQDLLREELIDVLRPSLALNGISQIRRMAALAEAYYVAVAPHHNGGPIATAAALHLAASLPEFLHSADPVASGRRGPQNARGVDRRFSGEGDRWFCCVAHGRGPGHHASTRMLWKNTRSVPA